LEDGTPVSGILTVEGDITLYAVWLSKSDREPYYGGWTNNNVSYVLILDQYDSYRSWYFSVDNIYSFSDWTGSSVDGKASSVEDDTLTVGGNTFTKVDETKIPAYDADISGYWEKDGVSLELGSEYGYTDGTAGLSIGFAAYMNLTYVVEDDTLYLLVYYSEYDYETWEDTLLPGEVILAIPIVGGAPDGWTKVVDEW
jgi:hypothetical protein